MLELNISFWYLFLSIFISIVGFAYYRYGKKQERPIPKYTGVILMIYPYFVTNEWALAGIGILLCAIPFFIK